MSAKQEPRRALAGWKEGEGNSQCDGGGESKQGEEKEGQQGKEQDESRRAWKTQDEGTRAGDSHQSNFFTIKLHLDSLCVYINII